MTRVAREIINTPHSKFGLPDKILWSHSKKGIYKVDEGYKLVTMEQDGIANYGMNGMGWKTCVMCDQEVKTLDHLFLKCLFARVLWFVSS